jgi:phosphate transport system substrate-binding protein
MSFNSLTAKIGGALLGLALAVLSASQSAAQTTLTSLDGKVNLTGELIRYDGSNYRIKTDVGDLIVRKEFVMCAGENCPEGQGPAVGDADSVLLLANDGSARIPGKLISVNDTEFVIESAHGVLTVRQEFVTCEGNGWPDSGPQLDRIMVAVPDTSVARLVTTIVGDYVSSKDFNLTEQLMADSDLPVLLIGDEEGLEVGRLSMAQMDNRTAMRVLFSGQVAFALTRERLTPKQVVAALGFSVQDISDVVTEEIIGLDAVDFVVSEGSSIDVMDLDAANAILAGQITNWSQLGGANAPVELHSLSQSAGLLEQLRVHGFSSAALVGDAELHDSVETMNEVVRARDNALGVAFRSQVQDVKSVSLSSACNVFVDSSEFAIQTEEYPLGVRLYRYTLKTGAESELG